MQLSCRITGALALTVLFLSGAANAALIQAFDVTSTSKVNCGSAAHGLWTGNYYSGHCANYFDIKGRYELHELDGVVTGTLSATAVNPYGRQASITMKMWDFAEIGPYKREGGYNWKPHEDAQHDIDFFLSYVGEINIDGEVFQFTPFGYKWQWGLGANAKRKNEYGASAWIQPASELNQLQQYQHQPLGHWDLNLQLTAVPEPGTFALLFVGLVGVFGLRRHQSQLAQEHTPINIRS